MAYRRQDLRGSALGCSTRAEALAEQCGGASTPALRQATERLPLTAREREIVMLIGEGLSSRAVAERLTLFGPHRRRPHLPGDDQDRRGQPRRTRGAAAAAQVEIPRVDRALRVGALDVQSTISSIGVLSRARPPRTHAGRMADELSAREQALRKLPLPYSLALRLRDAGVAPEVVCEYVDVEEACPGRASTGSPRRNSLRSSKKRRPTRQSLRNQQCPPDLASPDAWIRVIPDMKPPRHL